MTAPQPTEKTTMRSTLDLPRGVNQETRRWCAQAAVEADVPVVPMNTALRLLLELLLDGEPQDDPIADPELQERLHRAMIRGIRRVHESGWRDG